MQPYIYNKFTDITINQRFYIKGVELDMIGNRDNNNTLEKLRRMYETESIILNDLKKEYKSLPAGNLYIKNKKGRYCYYLYKNSVCKGIKRNEAVLQKLIKKKILEDRIFVLDINCLQLGECIKNIEDEWERREHKPGNTTIKRIYALPDMEPFVMTPEEYKWKNEAYKSNPYKIEYLKYQTESGVKLRSKSEKIIADKLEKYEILYRYEPEFQMGNSTYYPDFVIRRKDGKLVIWEHLGIMDNKDYNYKAWRKIEMYQTAGFYQHSNLICTYESDIENAERLDEIIRRFILM